MQDTVMAAVDDELDDELRLTGLPFGDRVCNLMKFRRTVQ